MERELAEQTHAASLRIGELEAVNEALRKEQSHMASQLAQRTVLYSALQRQCLESRSASQLQLTAWERQTAGLEGKLSQLSADQTTLRRERDELLLRCQTAEREVRGLEQTVRELEEAAQALTVDLHNSQQQHLSLQSTLDHLKSGSFSLDQLQLDYHADLSALSAAAKTREAELRAEVEQLRGLLREDGLRRDQWLEERADLLRRLAERDELLLQIQQLGLHPHAHPAPAHPQDQPPQPPTNHSDQASHTDHSKEESPPRAPAPEQAQAHAQAEVSASFSRPREVAEEDEESVSWLLQPSDSQPASQRHTPTPFLAHRPPRQEEGPSWQELLAALGEVLQQSLRWEDVWPLGSQREVSAFLGRVHETLAKLLASSAAAGEELRPFLREIGRLLLLEHESLEAVHSEQLQELQAQLLERTRKEKSKPTLANPSLALTLTLTLPDYKHFCRTLLKKAAEKQLLGPQDFPEDISLSASFSSAASPPAHHGPAQSFALSQSPGRLGREEEQRAEEAAERVRQLEETAEQQREEVDRLRSQLSFFQRENGELLEDLRRSLQDRQLLDGLEQQLAASRLAEQAAQAALAEAEEKLAGLAAQVSALQRREEAAAAFHANLFATAEQLQRSRAAALLAIDGLALELRESRAQTAAEVERATVLRAELDESRALSDDQAALLEAAHRDKLSIEQEARSLRSSSAALREEVDGLRSALLAAQAAQAEAEERLAGPGPGSGWAEEVPAAYCRLLDGLNEELTALTASKRRALELLGRQGRELRALSAVNESMAADRGRALQRLAGLEELVGRQETTARRQREAYEAAHEAMKAEFQRKAELFSQREQQHEAELAELTRWCKKEIGLLARDHEKQLRDLRLAHQAELAELTRRPPGCDRATETEAEPAVERRSEEVQTDEERPLSWPAGGDSSDPRSRLDFSPEAKSDPLPARSPSPARRANSTPTPLPGSGSLDLARVLEHISREESALQAVRAELRELEAENRQLRTARETAEEDVALLQTQLTRSSETILVLQADFGRVRESYQSLLRQHEAVFLQVQAKEAALAEAEEAARSSHAERVALMKQIAVLEAAAAAIIPAPAPASPAPNPNQSRTSPSPATSPAADLVPRELLKGKLKEVTLLVSNPTPIN